MTSNIQGYFEMVKASPAPVIPSGAKGLLPFDSLEQRLEGPSRKIGTKTLAEAHFFLRAFLTDFFRADFRPN